MLQFFFMSPIEDKTTMRRSFRLKGKGSTFIFSYFKTLSLALGTGIKPNLQLYSYPSINCLATAQFAFLT